MNPNTDLRTPIAAAGPDDLSGRSGPSAAVPSAGRPLGRKRPEEAAPTFRLSPLHGLHADIEARAQHIRASQPDWLCSKGCDNCCRRLADVPQLTAAEWDLLRTGLAALAPERLAQIHRDMAALTEHASRPVVCPLLDQASGACPVYAQRPVACRSYGFYVQRELGLYCAEIESRVAAGALAEVIWGNHDVIDRQLAGLGESRPLTEWFARWEGGN